MEGITPREVRVRSELTLRQREVLVGTLLGDGCLARHGRHCRLHIKQKAAHRALVEFKHRVFRNYVSMKPHEFDQRLLGKCYPSVQFATRTSRVFSAWRDRFYQGGRKIVPEGIDEWLSPLALAVWFMDDGAADYAGVTFQTHSFQPREVDRLASVLREKFRLAVRIRKNKCKDILYVEARSMELLRRSIGPYILAELAYKLEPRRPRTP